MNEAANMLRFASALRHPANQRGYGAERNPKRSNAPSRERKLTTLTRSCRASCSRCVKAAERPTMCGTVTDVVGSVNSGLAQRQYLRYAKLEPKRETSQLKPHSEMTPRPTVWQPEAFRQSRNLHARGTCRSCRPTSGRGKRMRGCFAFIFCLGPADCAWTKSQPNICNKCSPG